MCLYNMKTVEDYFVNYRHYGEVKVPQGTPVTHNTAVDYDEDYCFIEPCSLLKEANPEIANILEHDVKYNGLRVPHSIVDEYQDAPTSALYLTIMIKKNKKHKYSFMNKKYYQSGWEDEINGDLITLEGNFRVERKDCVIIK